MRAAASSLGVYAVGIISLSLVGRREGGRTALVVRSPARGGRTRLGRAGSSGRAAGFAKGGENLEAAPQLALAPVSLSKDTGAASAANLTFYYGKPPEIAKLKVRFDIELPAKRGGRKAKGTNDNRANGQRILPTLQGGVNPTRSLESRSQGIDFHLPRHKTGERLNGLRSWEKAVCAILLMAGERGR